MQRSSSSTEICRAVKASKSAAHLLRSAVRYCAGTLMDSFDVAQWADAHSQRDDGAKLFPADQLEAVQECAPCSCHHPK